MAGRPSAASRRQRALASQRTASRSRGIRYRCLALEVSIVKLECIEAVTTYVLRHRPKSSNAEALHRPLRIRQNIRKSMYGEASQQVPEAKIHGTVFVFSTPSTSLVSLTVRSTRTILLRSIAG
jgi:hypothetical protein